MNVVEIKKFIKAQLLKQLEHELLSAKSAHENTKEYTESDDLKQEGKYDTRAIEANYLKDAQARRVHELSFELEQLKSLNTNPHEIVQIGSIIKILEDDKQRVLYISPAQALSSVEVEEMKITIITHSSPLGEQLINLETGEGFELELAGNTKEIEILEVL